MLTPLQLGLGVQMHHFASKFLINTLYKYGFSCAYNEVIQYERNAAVALGKDLPETPQGSHIEFVADNVDHNLSTIDGTGTFHGMGIIATVTPCSPKPSKPIPRGPISTEQIAKIGKINTEFFKILPSPTPLTSATEPHTSRRPNITTRHDVEDILVAPNLKTSMVGYDADASSW